MPPKSKNLSDQKALKTSAGKGRLRQPDVESGIRPLRKAETERLVALYQRAFWDDPAVEFLLPDESRRAGPMDAYMRMMIRYGQRYGRVRTVAGGDGALRCGSVWLPPGAAPPGLIGLLRSGFIQMLATTWDMAVLRRFMATMSMLEKIHKKDMPKLHSYLAVLAVDPPDQGKGLGSAVLDPDLRDADQSALPCYVETAKERNLAFYPEAGLRAAEGSTDARWWPADLDPHSTARAVASKAPGVTSGMVAR